MNKDLGLRFLRVVNESGLNGWGQVYARMPFEETEIEEKGSLFGAIFAKGENSPEREAEIMVWVDEYYNQDKGRGQMQDFWNKFSDKFGDIDSVWVRVTIEDGVRKARVVRSGESGVVIIRGEARAELAGSQLDEGKVIVGKVEGGDRMIVWVGEMKEMIGDLENEASEEESIDGVVGKLIKDQVGAAGLILKFEKMDVDIDFAKSVSSSGDKEKLKKYDLEPLVDEFSGIKTIPQSQGEKEVVSDRLIGPLRMKDKVVNWWRKRSALSDVRVDRVGGTKKKKLAMGLGLLFLLLLVTSVVFGSIKMREDRMLARWVSFSEPIEKKRLEAESSLKINQVGSKKLLEEARVEYESGKVVFENTKYKEKLIALDKKLSDSWQSASGEKMGELLSRISFDLVRQGFIGDRLVWVKDNTVLVLDASMGAVASVGLETKEIKILAGRGEGQGWLDIVPFDKTGFIVGNKGIGIIGTEVKMTSFDSAVSDPVAGGVFGKNLYVLDKGNREIYKYNIVGNEIGERQRWLKQDQVVGLSVPVDMAIDGDVWLVGATAGVERFRRGIKETFSLSGCPEGAVFERVAVETDGEKLAMLDKVHGWVLVFNKESGEFVTHIKLDELKEARDVEYDGEGRLWVMIKGEVAEIR